MYDTPLYPEAFPSKKTAEDAFRQENAARVFTYKPGDDGFMETMARQLVWEVISGRTLYR
jgi:hypothetical protein